MKKRNGFTIVELFVVILIVTILGAFLIAYSGQSARLMPQYVEQGADIYQTKMHAEHLQSLNRVYLVALKADPARAGDVADMEELLLATQQTTAVIDTTLNAWKTDINSMYVNPENIFARARELALERFKATLVTTEPAERR